MPGLAIAITDSIIVNEAIIGGAALVDNLLLETGDNTLLETGNFLLLET